MAHLPDTCQLLQEQLPCAQHFDTLHEQVTKLNVMVEIDNSGELFVEGVSAKVDMY